MNKNKIVGLCSDQNELHTQVAQTGLSNAALWLRQREKLQQANQNPRKNGWNQHRQVVEKRRQLHRSCVTRTTKGGN